MIARQVIRVLAALSLLGCSDRTATEPRDFAVQGRVALASLIALSDGHLQQIAGHFEVLASSPDAVSADWERVRGPLASVAEHNVPALIWFALPDGSYWSVQGGKAAGNLTDRAYWPRLMAGQTVLGDLVVSKATGKPTAIVAVPIRNGAGAIVGAFGSSVYLDSLSLRIKREMDLQPDELFFAIDSTPIASVQDDPTEVFLDPFALNEPELERAIREIMRSDESVVTYTFGGKTRTVICRHSPVTAWWYCFGHVW